MKKKSTHDVRPVRDRLRIFCNGQDVGPCVDEDVNCPKCHVGLDVTIDIIVEEYEDGDGD